MSKEFGEIIKRLRMKCGYTQLQIARPLNVDRSTYSNYERGISEPDIETIKKLAKIFNVNMTVLMPIEGHVVKVSDISDVPFYNITKKEKAFVTWLRLLDDDQKEQVMEFMIDLAGKKR